MEQVKIISPGKDTRLIPGYVYTLERLDSGLLRISSVGGKFSTLVNPDTSDVEFEILDEAVQVQRTGWRNSFAVKLWSKVYSQSIIVDSYRPEAAAERADVAVALFNERWQGDTFINVGWQHEEPERAPGPV